MIPARIIHLDAKGSTHAPPHRAVSFAEPPCWDSERQGIGVRGWRLDAAILRMMADPRRHPLWIDVWLVNGQRVRVRPSAKWLEARKEMFK